MVQKNVFFFHSIADSIGYCPDLRIGIRGTNDEVIRSTRQLFKIQVDNIASLFGKHKLCNVFRQGF
jgi:hypothetical protein